MLIIVTSLTFAAIGLVLGGLGSWLVVLGGSWYYAITGIAFLLTAYWLFERKTEALWLYAAILVGSMIWAVWEVGFDWWQLGARGGAIVVLGLWLWMPWIRNKLRAGWRGGTIVLAIANVVAIVVAVYSMFQDPQDISGSLSTEQVATTPDLGADFAYKHRNGTVRDMTPLPLPFKVGVPGIGGPMITKGGVAFLGAAVDNFFRAYDLTSGTQLWEARLPAGGQSTPMTYTANGKQYVVIVAGGHGSIGTKPGDYVVAYTLP